MTWNRLANGPHVGKTLPEVMFEDPDYVLDGIEAGIFDGSMLVEAVEVRRRAARIRVPRDESEEQEVVVLYHLLPNRSFGGFVIVAGSDPKLADYKRFSAARSDGLDLSMPRRLAPGDRTATKGCSKESSSSSSATPIDGSRPGSASPSSMTPTTSWSSWPPCTA